MKIGVITFSNTKDNYGQILQCYALQTYLRKLGHDPFLIRYQDSANADTTGFKWNKLFVYLAKMPTYVKWYLDQRRQQKRDEAYRACEAQNDRHFDLFLKENVQCTDVYNAETIKINPPQADAYICGSDQIWAGEDAYYLSFAPDEAVKIAYAPSFGGLSSFPLEKKERMRALISRLDRVGMREQSGVRVCRDLGIEDAVQVVDPTLLLPSDDYLKIAKQQTARKPYAFVYLLGNPIDETISNIADYVGSLGLDMVYTASQGRVDDYPKVFPTIEEWLGLVANADVVITNSFHCVVFALQFRRRLIAVPLSGNYKRMNTRIEDLLEKAGLSDLILQDKIKNARIGEIDFSKLDRYLHEQRQFSKSFLDLSSLALKHATKNDSDK